MATINVRKETGTLYIDFRFAGVRCREQTRLQDTLNNRRKLKGLINRMDAEIVLGQFDYAKTFPNGKNCQLFSTKANHHVESKRFVNFSLVWINEMSPNWRLSYEQTVRYLISTKLCNKFGQCFVSQITKADILKFRSELIGPKIIENGNTNSKLSSRYVNRVVSLLCSILSEASTRFDFADPSTEIKPLKVRKKEVLPLNLSEVKKVINGAPTDFKDYFVVRFFTGLRTGELHALKWQHINFLDRQILVSESIVNGVIGNTKSTSSDRLIQMSDAVYMALKRLEKVKESDFVFVRNGEPLTQSYVTQSIWYPLLKRLNLSKRRPYETRHTAATLWLAAGENPEWIARQLGHSNTQILFDTYSRFVPNLTRMDGSAANKFFNQLGVK
jgi:integrase